MSNIVSQGWYGLWTSGRGDVRALIGLVGLLQVFAAGFAISSWVAAGAIMKAAGFQFALVWTSFLVIGVAFGVATFVVRPEFRAHCTMGAIVALSALMGQVGLISAVQFANTTVQSFTAVSVFSAILAILFTATAALVYHLRHDIVPEPALRVSDPLPAIPSPHVIV
ncbi:hypothetical protein PBRA_007644 [Plasmodiophora brassicae]|nr:hypothetical protein PBRA_007644 [Plasmodiophora brassicae]